MNVRKKNVIFGQVFLELMTLPTSGDTSLISIHIPLTLDDIQLTFDSLKDIHAWKGYLKQLEKTSNEKGFREDPSEKSKNQQSESERMDLFGWIKGKKWYFYTTIAVTVIIVFIGSLSILNRNLRTISPADEVAKASKPSIAVLPFINPE